MKLLSKIIYGICCAWIKEWFIQRKLYRQGWNGTDGRNWVDIPEIPDDDPDLE